MLNSTATIASSVASVRSYTEVSAETGNYVIYAQQYASSGTKIGDAIQVTSDTITANPVSTILLSDGKFVVAYNYLDPLDTSTSYPYFYLATEEFGGDGSKIASNFLGLNDFNTSQSYKSTALGDGSYGYLNETFRNGSFGEYEETKTFGFVDASGHVTETVLAQTGGGDGPFAVLRQSAGSINVLADGRFTVTFTEYYSEGSPEYPPSEPVPTGQQQYNRVYTRDGELTTSIAIDFDGTKTVERFDPATGSETELAVFNTDGSRISTQFGITGRYYVEQSVATDPTGAITEQKRYYGDAHHTLAFSLTNKPDGTSEVHNYDKAGRETGRQVGNLRAEHDVQEFVYAGAAKATLSSSTLTHYDANNAKAFIDVTQANGNHRQRSYADGVTLTSHETVADTLFGLAKGSDAFAFHANFGKDVVSGFASGSGANHDVLQFDRSLAQDFATLSQHFHQIGANTLISFDAENSVLLKGVSAASITPDNVQIIQHDALLV